MKKAKLKHSLSISRKERRKVLNYLIRHYRNVEMPDNCLSLSSFTFKEHGRWVGVHISDIDNLFHLSMESGIYADKYSFEPIAPNSREFKQLYLKLSILFREKVFLNEGRIMLINYALCKEDIESTIDLMHESVCWFLEAHHHVNLLKQGFIVNILGDTVQMR